MNYNSKIKIKVPATSANLGPGFDCLGIALNLYNTFIFEEYFKWEYINFDIKHQNENNLVVRSMKKVYELKGKTTHPFRISLDCQVPISRGLGSSATCIIAGLLAANYYLGNFLSKEQILKLATEIEGHPDNVAPCLIGSLVSSVNSDEIITVKHEINPDLNFITLIPNFTLATEEARNVLPQTISYKNAIYNMSRALNIPYALKTGDIELLFKLMSDKMHEVYRFPLIEDADIFLQFSKDNKIPFCISGSGSTLLMITKNIKYKEVINLINQLNVKAKWEIKVLKPDLYGTKIEVLDEE